MRDGKGEGVKDFRAVQSKFFSRLIIIITFSSPTPQQYTCTRTMSNAVVLFSVCSIFVLSLLLEEVGCNQYLLEVFSGGLRPVFTCILMLCLHSFQLVKLFPNFSLLNLQPWSPLISSEIHAGVIWLCLSGVIYPDLFFPVFQRHQKLELRQYCPEENVVMIKAFYTHSTAC